MKKIIALFSALVCLTACKKEQETTTEAQQETARQEEKSVTLVAPAGFKDKMEAHKGQVLDVRTAKEYQSGHIEGAVNMHIYDKDFEQQLEKLDKNEPVYVYCKAGGRSAEAVNILITKDFKHIIELQGGMDNWKEAGLPVVE